MNVGIACLGCGESHYKEVMFDYFEICETNHKRLGIESFYKYDMDDSCPVCNQLYELELYFYEYPENEYSSLEIVASDLKILVHDDEKFDIEDILDERKRTII